MSVIELTSFSDPALDPYARLTENQLRSRKHPDQGIFIAESRTVVTLALNAGYTPVSFLIEHSQLTGNSADLVSRITQEYPDTPIYTAAGSLLEELTGFTLSRGVLAVMRRPSLPSPEEICRNARRIAVLENIMDAANVGAVIRSAAALGMDAVLLTPQCSDPLLRRAARVSMGTVFQIPWTYLGADASDWPENGMNLLHGMGFRTAAMALSRNTVEIGDRCLKEEDKLAVILGTEGTGLTDATIALSDYTVKIPMFHGVDSLNVAAAGALAFWELGKR